MKTLVTLLFTVLLTTPVCAQNKHYQISSNAYVSNLEEFVTIGFRGIYPIEKIPNVKIERPYSTTITSSSKENIVVRLEGGKIYVIAESVDKQIKKGEASLPETPLGLFDKDETYFISIRYEKTSGISVVLLKDGLENNSTLVKKHALIEQKTGEKNMNLKTI